MTDTNYIPDESEVNAPQTGGSYRISNGMICRGREEENNLETRDKIVGRLLRFAVQEGQGDKGPYAYLEAEFQTARGNVRVHTNLLDKAGRIAPSAVCCSFAEGLLDLQPSELATLTARQGYKKNQFGTYSTYANIFHTSDDGKKLIETKRRTWAPDTKYAEQWPVLFADLQKHPAWKIRERSASEDDRPDGSATTHLSALCKECQEKGWPTPEQNPGGWLALMAKGFGHDVRARLSDYRDDEWGEVRQAYQQAKECPPILQPAPSQGSFSAV